MQKFRQFFVKELQVPSELLLKEAKITLYGKKRVVIERHKNIKYFNENEIVIDTENGIVKVDGEKLMCKNYGKDDLIVDGFVKSVQYEESK